MKMPRYWLISLFYPAVLLLVKIQSNTCFSPRRDFFALQGSSKISWRLRAHSLTTSLEYLASERTEKKNGFSSKVYQALSWLDFVNETYNRDHQSLENCESIPLYPLPAVYLPTRDNNHTLNNVEPQNIQMAQDLLQGFNQSLSTTKTNSIDDKRNRARFCVVLRATDTGRIASVGTILSIVEAEEQYHYGTNDVARMRLTCQVEGLAEICCIENGSEWSRRRLMRSKEYLRALVRPKNSVVLTHNPTNHIPDYFEKLAKLLKESQTVKTMYQLGLGASDFPPGTITKLGDAMKDFDHIKVAELDSITEQDIDEIFWTVAQEWQSVCYTLRQGQQALMSAERNEKMIEAARAKGGPLKLPIHLEDLEPEDRKAIQQIEMQAQVSYLDLNMDPILDFQVLLSLPSLSKRIEWLSQMILRERQRLEKIASNQYA